MRRELGSGAEGVSTPMGHNEAGFHSRRLVVCLGRFRVPCLLVQGGGEGAPCLGERVGGV